MNRGMCSICEGEFRYSEVVIEKAGVKYCEACYEDITEEVESKGGGRK